MRSLHTLVLHTFVLLGILGVSSVAEAQIYSQGTPLLQQGISDFSGDNYADDILLPNYVGNPSSLGYVTVTVRGYISATLTEIGGFGTFRPFTAIPVEIAVSVIAPGLYFPNDNTTYSTADYRASSPTKLDIVEAYSETFNDYQLRDFMGPGAHDYTIYAGVFPNPRVDGVLSIGGVLNYQILETFNIPEPASLALLGFAVAAFAGVRCRKSLRPLPLRAA